MNQKVALSLHAPSRVRAALDDVGPHPSEDVAAWLQEVARRPWVSDRPAASTPGPLAAIRAAPRDERRHRPWIQNGRDLVGLGALTAGWLQYYFLDTMVHINSLPKVVIFVPLGVG